MGEIYKGHTVQTGDAVAVKVLLPEFAENEAALGLFRREASALHNLHHEAIVRYYVFTIEPVLRRPYLAMEFVEGQSLADLIRREPLTYEAVRLLLKRVAAGLHAAHERGIIHRDVSSDNIMIPGGDVARAKIIDFGIARSTQLGDRTIIGGGFAGKYNYVSPEQLGLFGGDVQARSDIYSLGLVLAEALTGRPIDMGGSQAAVLDKRRKVPDLGAVDLRIRPLLERMLQPDPAARPESMAHVATWPLATSRPSDSQYASDLGWSGDGRSRAASESPRPRRRWIAVAAAVPVVILVAAGAAYYVLQPERGDVSEPPAPPLSAAPSTPPPLSSPGRLATSEPSSPAGPALVPSAPSAPAQPPVLSPRPPAPSAPSAAAPSNTPPPALTPAPPGPTAALPPSGSTDTAALQPLRPGPSDQITQFVNQYDGGDCFFIAPSAVSASAARIDGYGASASPFQVLDDAFKRSNGFEAEIEVRQVTTAQCPALTFLGRLRHERARAPRLMIGDTNLTSGQALTGSVEATSAASVQLLLVSDEGLVVDVSNLLKQTGEARTFNLRMRRTGAAGAQPQLLIAVASARPLETLKGANASPADQLFPLALVEATRTGQSIAAAMRYFKLDL
jgi:serine/threonine-protein kinase